MRIEFLFIILLVLYIINKNCDKCMTRENFKVKQNKKKAKKMLEKPAESDAETSDTNNVETPTESNEEQPKMEKGLSIDKIVNTFNKLKGQILNFMEKWEEIRGLHRDYNEKLINTDIPFKMKTASQKRFEAVEKNRSDFEKSKVNLLGIFSMKRRIEELNYRRTKENTFQFFNTRNDKIEIIQNPEIEKFNTTLSHIDMWIEFIDNVWIPFFREEINNFNNYLRGKARGMVGGDREENAKMLKSKGITQIATTPEINKKVDMDGVSPTSEIGDNYTSYKSDNTRIKISDGDYEKDMSTGDPKPLKQVDPNFSYYGWTYMPPTTWTVPQRKPPICLGEKEKVSEYPTTGYPLESLNWEPDLVDRYKLEQSGKGIYYQDGQPPYPKYTSEYYNMHKSEEVIKNI